MARLGEFGRPITPDTPGGMEYVAAEADWFTFHGEEFTLQARLSALPMLRFADEGARLEDREHRLKRRRVRAVTDADKAECDAEEADIEMRSQGSTYQFLKAMITEEEWPVFEDTAIRVGAPLDELLAVAHQIIAAVTGRPTRRSSDSSGGPRTTPSGSTEPSSSAGDPPAQLTQPVQAAGPDPVGGRVVRFRGQQREGDPDGEPQAVTGEVLETGDVAPWDERYSPAAAALGISPNEAQRREIAANLAPLEELV